MATPTTIGPRTAPSAREKPKRPESAPSAPGGVIPRGSRTGGHHDRPGEGDEGQADQERVERREPGADSSPTPYTQIEARMRRWMPTASANGQRRKAIT